MSSQIILVFCDEYNKLPLVIDKQVLITNSEYFKLMFNGNYLENGVDIIAIGVPDTRIAYNIFRQLSVIFDTGNQNNSSINSSINSSTNLSACREISLLDNHCNKNNRSIELLREYICRNFFLMKIDIDTDLTVPYEKFHKLLDMIDIIGITNETIKLLANNIPLDFDIEYLPTNLLSVLKNYLCGSAIIIEKYDSIEIINLANKKIIRTLQLQQSIGPRNNYCYLYAGLIAIRDNNIIYIYDFIKQKIITKIINDKFTNNHLNRIIYLSTRNQIVIGCQYNCLRFYDISTGKLMETCNVSKNKIETKELSSICISPNQNYIAIYSNNKLFLINMKDNSLKIVRDEISTVKYTYFSPNNMHFFYYGYSFAEKNIISRYDINNNKPEYSINGLNINYYLLSPNDKYLYLSINHRVEIFDKESNKIVFTMKVDYCIYAIDFISNDTIVISGTGQIIEIWNFITGKLVDQIPTNNTVYHLNIIPGHHQHMIDKINKIIKQ